MVLGHHIIVDKGGVVRERGYGCARTGVQRVGDSQCVRGTRSLRGWVRDSNPVHQRVNWSRSDIRAMCGEKCAELGEDAEPPR